MVKKRSVPSAASRCRSRRYAAAITSDLLADDGTPLGAGDVFRRATASARSDALVLRVRDAIAPALDDSSAPASRQSDRHLAAFTTET